MAIWPDAAEVAAAAHDAHARARRYAGVTEPAILKYVNLDESSASPRRTQEI